MEDKVLIVATTAYMMKQFNVSSIYLLIKMGYSVELACNIVDAGPISSDDLNLFLDDMKLNNIKVHHIPFPRNPLNFRANFKSYRKLKSIFKNSEYLMCHCHTPIASMLTRIVTKNYRNKGLKVIYTAHGFHFYKGSSPISWILFYPIERTMSRYTDVIITINKEDYDLAFQKFKMEKLKYIPGVGINRERFYRNSKLRNETRKKLNLNKSDQILINVGELNDNKNQRLLIESMPMILKAMDSVKLLIVGQGPNYDLYSGLISSLNLEKHVILLGYRKDINDLLNASDILVSCSYREGLPVNVMEAMTIGLPVVATDIRGNRDLIKDGKNGYLVSHSKQAIANAIIKILRNTEHQKSIEINNLLESMDYSDYNILQDLETIYQTTISSKR